MSIGDSLLRGAWQGGVLVAVGVGIWWTAGFLLQRSMMYPAPPAGPGRLPAGAEQVWLSTPTGRVEAWFLPSAGASGPMPVLLFFHGNGELIDHWPDEFTGLLRVGLGVLLVEYPGYGRSEGAPSERSIRDAGLAAWDWAESRPEIDGARIIPYGRSLGGGAACIVARERHAPALILESAFAGVRPLARRMGMPGFLVRDPFDNLNAVRTFEGPILIVHGERDEVIPVSHGHGLYGAARDGTLRLLPCGHNDCPRPWGEVVAFLERAGLLEQ